MNPRLKLFRQIEPGTGFHYGDDPKSVRIKAGTSYSVGANGVHRVDPNVLVFEEKVQVSDGKLYATQNLDRLRV